MKQSYPTYSLATVLGDSSRAHPLSSAAGLVGASACQAPHRLHRIRAEGRALQPVLLEDSPAFPKPPSLAWLWWVPGSCVRPVCHLHNSHTSSRPRACAGGRLRP